MPDNQIDIRALWSFTYGLYVVTSKDGEAINGQIANSVFQVTSDPPRIAVTINKDNYTHELITNSGMVGVSVLEESAPLTFIGRFGFRSGRDYDKLSGVKYETGQAGIPCVTENSLSYMEGKVIGSLDTGTHTLFLTELTGSKILKKGNPLTYTEYRSRKGKVPKNAPISEPEPDYDDKKGE